MIDVEHYFHPEVGTACRRRGPLVGERATSVLRKRLMARTLPQCQQVRLGRLFGFGQLDEYGLSLSKGRGGPWLWEGEIYEP